MNRDQSARGLVADATEAADRILERLEKTPLAHEARAFLIAELGDILDEERTAGLRQSIEVVQHLRRASLPVIAAGSFFGMLVGFVTAYVIWGLR